MLRLATRFTQVSARRPLEQAESAPRDPARRLPAPGKRDIAPARVLGAREFAGADAVRFARRAAVAMTASIPTISHPLQHAAVLLNAAQNAILVTGMMLLMIAGAFDLSVGSTLALAGVWAGVVVGWWGWPRRWSAWWPASPWAALAGLVNGLIVTRLGINALITTLATMTIFRGLTYLTAGTGVTPIGDDFKAYGQTVFPARAADRRSG